MFGTCSRMRRVGSRRFGTRCRAFGASCPRRGPAPESRAGAYFRPRPPVSAPCVNQLLLGDNLAILRQLPDASVDLVYLDPPFFSNRTYEVIWGDAGERRSFEDR